MDGCWWNCRLSICRQISQVRNCNNFQFLNSQRKCQLCIKKAPKQAKDFFNMVSVSLEGLSMFSDRIVDFLIFCQISQVRTCNNFQFLNSQRTCQLCIKKAPKQAKDVFNMVSVSLEGLSIFSDRILDFLIFRQISQVRTCNNFKFLNSHRTC